MSVGIYQDTVRPFLCVRTYVPSINTTCTVNHGLCYILDPCTITMLCMYSQTSLQQHFLQGQSDYYNLSCGQRGIRVHSNCVGYNSKLVVMAEIGRNPG